MDEHFLQTFRSFQCAQNSDRSCSDIIWCLHVLLCLVHARVNGCPVEKYLLTSTREWELCNKYKHTFNTSYSSPFITPTLFSVVVIMTSEWYMATCDLLSDTKIRGPINGTAIPLLPQHSYLLCLWTVSL